MAMASVGTNTETSVDTDISSKDIKRYHEFGLGRGINVTELDMWKNKSAFVVRKIAVDPKLNLVVTDEAGMIEAYTKEIASAETQQYQILLSLADPNSRVKVEMDAYHSQGTSSLRVVSGTKYETKTISFKTDFNDVPLYASMDVVSLEIPNNINCPDSFFESQLYCWILKRFRDRLIKKLGINHIEENLKNLKGFEGDCAATVTTLVDVLAALISAEDPQEQKKKTATVYLELINDCTEFLTNVSVTHYVSAIKLGAMEYQAFTQFSKRKLRKGGAEIEEASIVKGRVSGSVGREWLQREEKSQKIGVIGDHTKEAVIGFQIQSIDTLVRVQFVQMALRQAIKEHVRSKTDKCKGPFLISCKVGCKAVYWVVNDKYQLMGTPYIKSASLFYIKPADDPSRPSDFFIMYYGKSDYDRKILMNLTDPYVKLQEKETLLPHYLVSDTNILGFSDKPLELKMGFRTSQAQFSLHSRAQSPFACLLMCQSTPVSMQSWLEGEQFYVSCNSHSFKVDGYVAMEKSLRSNSTRKSGSASADGEDENPSGANPSDGKDENPECSMEEGDDRVGEEHQLIVLKRKSNHTAGETKSDSNDFEYKTVVELTIKDSSSPDVGMLFRLHPKEFQRKYNQQSEIETISPSCVQKQPAQSFSSPGAHEKPIASKPPGISGGPVPPFFFPGAHKKPIASEPPSTSGGPLPSPLKDDPEDSQQTALEVSRRLRELSGEIDSRFHDEVIVPEVRLTNTIPSLAMNAIKQYFM